MSIIDGIIIALATLGLWALGFYTGQAHAEKKRRDEQEDRRKVHGANMRAMRGEDRKPDNDDDDAWEEWARANGLKFDRELRTISL